MGRPLKSITIVGGGTSGWLTAVFLARAAKASIEDGSLEIALIESPKIPIIGVGESTSPALPQFFQAIGVDEKKFIKQANATFKLSGYFDNWNVFPDGSPRTWINPFMAQKLVSGRSAGYYYLKYGRVPGGLADGYTNAISPCPELIRLGRGPRLLGKGPYESVVQHAYHMDALILAEHLRDLGISKGVKHIVDDVVNVNLDERGFVSSLDLEKHGSHPIELVIDSTGFAGVIINKALGEPFVPFDKYLPNDRAVVMQIPHEDPTKIEPITRSTALGNGWVFNVPLFNRIGTGYVFSSQFTSDEAAAAEFKAHIGPRANDIEPRVIRMRIGKSRRSWVKNCVAIGLSSGFVEPLEATAIHSVDLAARWLYTHFPDSDFDPALADGYNKRIDALYDEIVDFVALHYRLNNRTDTEYWRVAREERPIPESLKGLLALWKYKMPDDNDLPSEYFFSAISYLAALMGKGFYDDITPELPGVEESAWRDTVKIRSEEARQLAAHLPEHYDLLRNLRGEDGMPPPPPSAPPVEKMSMSINFRNH